MLNQLDPLSGLPKRTRTAPAFGPGPAEPKSPAFGGYGGAPLAPNDPVSGSDPVAAKTPTLGPFSSPVATPDDLLALINSNPLYRQTQADVQAARVSDQASRTAARQRALVLYGGVPDLGGAAGALGLVGSDLGGDITDVVRQLAAGNTQAGLSTLGRLQRAHEDAVRQTKDQLAARGILSSGETGFQLGRQNTAFDQANYDAVQQLIDYLSGVNGSYLDNERARQQQLVNARTAAADSIPKDTAPDASTYFGQHPLPAGTTTQQALDALAALPPSTWKFLLPPDADYSLPTDANGVLATPAGGWTGGLTPNRGGLGE